MKKYKFRHKFIYFISFSILLILLLLILDLFGFFVPLENKVYDLTLFFKYLLFEPEIENVVLVSIDDKTIDELGPWPIERGYYAQAIEIL
ncbi:MAG: CHASE2 domain-containing protein, partial [bacterium]